jgi:hypothetical protein
VNEIRLFHPVSPRGFKNATLLLVWLGGYTALKFRVYTGFKAIIHCSYGACPETETSSSYLARIS